MFNQREHQHAYKTTTPKSPPAGFRFADFINPRRCFTVLEAFDMRSPDPSPLNSPVKGPRPLAENSSSFLDIPGRFPKPQRPNVTRPAPIPEEQHAKDNYTHTFTQTPLPKPPPRKTHRGPKHLSFTKGRNGSGTIPHHRHAQKMKEKTSAVHRQFRDRRRAARPRNLASLRREAQKLMKPENMTNEDKIFLAQIRELELNENMMQGLEECREQMARATDETDERRKEHEARDEEAAKMWGSYYDEEALEEQERKVAEFVRADEEMQAAEFQEMEEEALRADEERQRAHDARERQLREEQERMFREALARQAEEERRQREEVERQMREEQERREREERERQEREERKRRLDEQLREFDRREAEFMRFVRETKARLERVARMRAAREERARERLERERIAREEQERQARLLVEQARLAAKKAEQERHYFSVYEAKWNELRTNDALPLVNVCDMPWPVFGVVSSAEQITYEDVRAFLFHPQRPGFEGKTTRDKVKAEVLRFHPDKFNTRILPKIQPLQQAVAQAIAGAVARILTSIMTDEAEQQN